MIDRQVTTKDETPELFPTRSTHWIPDVDASSFDSCGCLPAICLLEFCLKRTNIFFLGIGSKEKTGSVCISLIKKKQKQILNIMHYVYLMIKHGNKENLDKRVRHKPEKGKKGFLMERKIKVKILLLKTIF